MNSDTRMKNANNLQNIGNFILDAEHGMLKLEASKTISLMGREAQILNELCHNKGEVVKRSVVLEKFRKLKEGHDPFFSSRSLYVMISNLRKKLKDDPNVKIQVIKGIGIMLVDHPVGKKA